MKSPVTIKDVARLAGVSPATVSNVLAGSKPVRDGSRDQVMAAVQELGYRVNPAASYLRKGRSRIVGAVIPSLQNPFFPSIVSAVERLCLEDGYELILASSAEQTTVEAARIDALLQWRPSGMIIIPCSNELPAREQIEAARIPLVFADRAPDGVSSDFIEIDNVEAGAMAARHLVELGHRRIAVCAPALEVRNIQERILGVRNVLAEIGEQPHVFATGFDDMTGQGLETQLADVTAAVGLMNTSTLQVLAAVNRVGRAVPESLSLVGFDDYAWMPVARPSITAVRQPIERIGESTWAQLLHRMRGDAGAPRHVKLPVELVLRESTAAPQGRPAPAARKRTLMEQS